MKRGPPEMPHIQIQRRRKYLRYKEENLGGRKSVSVTVADRDPNVA